MKTLEQIYSRYPATAKWAFDMIENIVIENGPNMHPNLLELLRKEYPKGTRVRLVSMDDLRPIPVGALGTVTGVDDIGSLMVQWDNGRRLNVLYGIDKVVVVEADREGFIRAIYDYLKSGYNGFVFDGKEKPKPISHEEAVSLMASEQAKTEIDVFLDECSYFNLEPSIRLTADEIERVINSSKKD